MATAGRSILRLSSDRFQLCLIGWDLVGNLDQRALPVLAIAAVLPLAIVTGCSSGGSRSGSQVDKSAQSDAVAVTTGPIAFARCMRRHGVHDYPEPDANGHMPQIPAGVTAQPGFAQAQKACAKYAEETEPNEMTAAGREQVAAAMHAVAVCMRHHGVNLSDPIVGANSMVQHLPSGVSPDDPIVKQARKKCAAVQARVLTLIGRFPGDPGTVPRADY